MVKNLPASTGDPGLIPGSRRSPRVRNGTPLQYSCMKQSMGREAWQATAHGAAKSRTQRSTHIPKRGNTVFNTSRRAQLCPHAHSLRLGLYSCPESNSRLLHPQYTSSPLIWTTETSQVLCLTPPFFPSVLHTQIYLPEVSFEYATYQNPCKFLRKYRSYWTYPTIDSLV